MPPGLAREIQGTKMNGESSLTRRQRKKIEQAYALLERFKKRAKSPYIAFTSDRLPGGKGYRFRYLILHPDSESLRGAEESMIYVYMERTPEDTTFHKLRAAVIPRTDRAKEVIGKWARGKKRQKTESAERSVLLEQGHTQSSDCFTETEYTTFCTIGTIDDPPLCFPVETEVVVCGESGSGDPLDPPPGPGTGDPSEGDDPCPDPWSCDDGSGSGNDNDNNDPSPGDDNCGEGSLPGTDDGQCVDEPDDPFEDPEPCETGDEIIDDPAIQEAFSNLWESSNFGSDDNPNPESERIEKGGFIVPAAGGGHVFQPMPSHLINEEETGPCRIRFSIPSDLPPGAIYVHTHPYKKNQLQNHCIPGKTLKYKNEVGVKDRKALETMGLDRGIILDADKIISYTPNTSENPTLINRCGY